MIKFVPYIRKFVPYIITAVLAAAVALAVSYFVSHLNFVVSVADGEKREWTEHYNGGKFYEHARKKKHSAKRPQFWGRGPGGRVHGQPHSFHHGYRWTSKDAPTDGCPIHTKDQDNR